MNIDSINDYIDFLTKEINESSRYDRIMMENQWAKGVMTKYQMMVYGKNYRSNNTKKLIRERNKQYRLKNQAIIRMLEENNG